MKNLSIIKAFENLKSIAKSTADELEKSLRWAHHEPSETPPTHDVAKTSHGKYHVSRTPDANGHHTVTYTTKRPKGSPRGTKGETFTGKFASHQEALGAVVQHHLKNRPVQKPRKKKDPNAPKKVKAPAARPDGCPPC